MRIKDKSIIKLPGSDMGKPGSDMGKPGSVGKWGDNEQVAFNPGANETTSSTQELIKNNSKPQGSTSVKYPTGTGMTPGNVGTGAPVSGSVGKSVIRDVGSKSSIQKLAEDYVNSNYDDFTKGTDYESLVKRYSAQGRQAMDDTIGQMAARTGGLASSYAASAGQQAYGGWMEKLEDAARSLYDSQQSERLSKLNVAQGIYDRDVADEQWNKTFEYQQGRDNVADDQWQQEFDRSGDQWQYQTEQEAADDFKDSIYDAAYWGNANWDDFKDNEYGITKAEFNRIVKSAEGARGDDTYERTLAKTEADELKAQQKQERAQNEVMMMWAAGVEPTDEQLAAAGWADKNESGGYATYDTGETDDDGNPIKSTLNNKGQAYYKRATYVEPVQAPTLSAEEAAAWQEFVSSDSVTEDNIEEVLAYITAATGNESFAFSLIAQKFPELSFEELAE